MTKNSKWNQKARAVRGFTLLEMLVVITIIGMVATLVTVAVVKQQEEAKVDTTKIQMQKIQEALDIHKIKYNEYPSTEQGLQELVNKSIMSKLPPDGWGNDFQYIRNNARSYVLKSLGGDKATGGEGLDADIVFEQ